jgi:hypothetical protein
MYRVQSDCHTTTAAAFLLMTVRHQDKRARSEPANITEVTHQITCLVENAKSLPFAAFLQTAGHLQGQRARGGRADVTE